jgi:hypothetical protein
MRHNNEKIIIFIKIYFYDSKIFLLQKISIVINKLLKNKSIG